MPVRSLLQHEIPRQSPQAATHFSPFALHEHLLLFSHGFLDDSLQLHRTTFRRWDGAASISVMIGVILPFTIFQPNSRGLKRWRSNDIQIPTWRWTLSAWKYIALSVGGNDAGSNFALSVTILLNLAWRNEARLSESLPSYSFNIIQTAAFFSSSVVVVDKV